MEIGSHFLSNVEDGSHILCSKEDEPHFLSLVRKGDSIFYIVWKSDHFFYILWRTKPTSYPWCGRGTLFSIWCGRRIQSSIWCGSSIRCHQEGTGHREMMNGMRLYNTHGGGLKLRARDCTKRGQRHTGARRYGGAINLEGAYFSESQPAYVKGSINAPPFTPTHRLDCRSPTWRPSG